MGKEGDLGEKMDNYINVKNNRFNFSVVPLAISAEHAVQGVDGTLFCVLDGILYRKEPGAKDFILSTSIDSSVTCSILAFDNGGNIYYSGSGSGALWRSRDYGRSFQICLRDVGGKAFRGFALDCDGSIYTGSYGSEGPASLYRSDDDGAHWTSIQTFRCRHIHTVTVNPHTNWLYVVCGERKAPHILDGNRVWRSKDKGETCFPIIEPKITSKGRARPLYLSIGFIKNTVALGTDHFEGDNYIATFEDTGEEREYKPKRCLTCPELSFSKGKGKGYCWQISNNGKAIWTVCVGDDSSILYTSHDAIHWHKCVTFSGAVGRNIEFYPYADKLLLSSRDGCKIIEFSDEISEKKDNINKEINISWQQVLLSHDTRYIVAFSKGYYLRSLVNTEKQNLVFDILEKYSLSKDAIIADVGCGVGPMLLAGRCRGFSSMCGIEANPRWLIAARHLYETSFSESPNLRLVPRGDFTLPLFSMDKLYDAVLIVGVFIGNGNAVPFEKALRVSYEKLNAGGICVFDIDPKTYGQSDMDIFLQKVAEQGYYEIRCRHFRDIFTVSCLKPSSAKTNKRIKMYGE